MPVAFVHCSRPFAFAMTLTFFLLASSAPPLHQQKTQKSINTPPHSLAKPNNSLTSQNLLPSSRPIGRYRCADSEVCDSPEDVAFELARQNDLASGDSTVIRAAEAYGEPTGATDDGVTIEFGDPGPGMQSATSHKIRGDLYTPNKLRAIETVIFQLDISAKDLEAAVGHEGSHVADAQDFVNAISPTGKIDQSKNLTSYQTEFRAYMVTQSILVWNKMQSGYGECGKAKPCHLGFGIPQIQAIETINELLANPANRCGVPPNFGVTPQNPGPALYQLLTLPYLEKNAET